MWLVNALHFICSIVFLLLLFFLFSLVWCGVCFKKSQSFVTLLKRFPDQQSSSRGVWCISGSFVEVKATEQLHNIPGGKVDQTERKARVLEAFCLSVSLWNVFHFLNMMGHSECGHGMGAFTLYLQLTLFISVSSSDSFDLCQDFQPGSSFSRMLSLKFNNHGLSFLHGQILAW